MLSVLCFCGNIGRAWKDFDFHFQVSASVVFRLSFLIVKRLLTLLRCFYRSPVHHCAPMMQRGADGQTPINISSPTER